MMNAKRILSVFRQFRRFPELVRCYQYFGCPTAIALSFTTLRTGCFPRILEYKRNGRLYHVTLPSWEDLRTAWTVILGNEYRIEKEDATILDIGGNIGLFAIYANSLNPHSRIISVEPFAPSYLWLVQVAAHPKLAPHLETRQLAISGMDGTVTMDASPGIPGHSRKISRKPGHADFIQAESKTLESFLDAESLDEVDFIKMDIEGAEYEVISQSSCRTLRRSRRYGIEYHGRGVEILLEKFRDAGFSLTGHHKHAGTGVVEFTRQPDKGHDIHQVRRGQ